MIHIWGDQASLDDFIRQIHVQLPPLAHIYATEVTEELNAQLRQTALLYQTAARTSKQPVLAQIQQLAKPA